MKKKSALFITQAAVIAALYAALTFVSGSLNLAYGSVQFRLSEILTILPVFTPAAIPGLTLGCVIANITSPLGIIDIVCGSAATLTASLASYALRKFTVKGIPMLSTLPPVVFNALIVGAELWYIYGGETVGAFALYALGVAAGEVVMCVIAGIPFIKAVQKTKIFDKINRFAAS